MSCASNTETFKGTSRCFMRHRTVGATSIAQMLEIQNSHLPTHVNLLMSHYSCPISCLYYYYVDTNL